MSTAASTIGANDVGPAMAGDNDINQCIRREVSNATTTTAKQCSKLFRGLNLFFLESKFRGLNLIITG